MSLEPEHALVLDEGADASGCADEAAAPFFAPMDGDIVDVLICDYKDRRHRIEQLAALMEQGVHQGVLSYFLEGNCADRDRRWSLPSVETLFKLDGAIAKLDAEFWQKALAQTDVYEAMPQKRRDEWNKAVMSNATPPFEEANVRSTLRDLLAQRSRFFAERIDGLFRALSGEHVTNRPEGFAKRMILSYVFNDYGSVNYSMAGVIGDLRAVIAKFMGREEPKHHSASSLLDAIKRSGTGEWQMIDGGAMRIRVYKKGTAHLEIHPDMAWRLNLVLASLYPAAIPAEHRSRPARPHREFGVLHRPLPFSVLELFESRLDRRQGDRPQVFEFGWGAKRNERAYELACQVLQLLGGGADPQGAWHFDYPIRPVLQTLVHHGCIPDEKAYQFYPTRERLARLCVELAQIGDEHTVLEPSAGQGGLAQHLPAGRTTCVELAGLNCEILRARGLQVENADFLVWAAATGHRFDRVVMNPPFAGGRARLHVQAAGGLLRPGGRLVAIVPVGMLGKRVIDRAQETWHGPFDNEFAGTTVSVAILVADLL